MVNSSFFCKIRLNFTRSYLQLLVVIQTFTPSRVVNAIWLFCGYIISRIVRKPVAWGLPISFALEPSAVCNLHCPECPTGAFHLQRSRGQMDIRRFQKWVLEGKNHLMHLTLFFQGEPLLNADIGQWVAFASQLRMYSLISTNGQILKPYMATQLVRSRLTELIFSVDGLTQESYERYRIGGSLQKVMESIELIVREKKLHRSNYPIVTIQFLVFAHNEHEVEGVPRFAKALGADGYQIKTAQFNDFGGDKVEAPRKNRYRRYHAGYSFAPTKYKHCWRQWSSGVMTWDGKVLPCCYDKDAQFVLGSFAEGLTVSWKGSRNIAFRQQILSQKYQKAICNNCPEGRSWLV